MISTIALVENGRTYRISAHMEGVATAAGATSQSEMRYTTNNTEPTTTSTLIGRCITDHRQSGIPDTIEFEGYFTATSDTTFRVALCAFRVLGTGNIDFSGGSGFPATLVIEDVGDTVATSGTVY